MPSWHICYNEEWGQEGDFWYHLFFCDRNKAAVSQLEKYTVIIVCYKNCIMPTQVISLPQKRKKICFPYDFFPTPNSKMNTSHVHLQSGRFRRRMSHTDELWDAGQCESRPPTGACRPRASQLLLEASSALLPGLVFLSGRQPREVDLHGIDVPVLVERHGNLVRQVVLRVIHGPRLQTEERIAPSHSLWNSPASE